MKQLLVTMFIIVCFTSTAFSQVIMDFEDDAAGTMGLADNNWGNSFASVAWAADPTGQSVGVLALDCQAGDGTKGVIQMSNLDPNGAPIICFYVYLPADFPDNASISLWGQDNVHWNGMNSTATYGSALPKETWVPVYHEILLNHLKTPDTFNPFDGNKFGKWGIQIYFSSAWTGTVLVDNGSLIGVVPEKLVDFEDEAAGTAGFADNNWGPAFTSVTRVADPTSESAGVLELACNAGDATKGAIQISNIDPKGAPLVSFMIYLPADFPDNASISLWGQDNVHWSGTNSTAVNGSALPKETWVPIYHRILVNHLKSPDTFDPYDGNKFGKWGMQLYFSSAWTGTVLVDNGQLLSDVIPNIEPEPKWVIATFENEIAGTQGFVESPSYNAITGISWAADPTGRSNGVLKTDWNASAGANDFIQNKNVDLHWTETDTGATAMSIDIWLPQDIPTESDLSIYAKDKITWTWTETHFTISDSTVVPGQWNTITYNVLDHLDKLNPVGVIEMGIQVYFHDPAWTGSIYFDDFTLVGIEKPAGELASPDIYAKLDTSETGFQYNIIEWVDNEEDLSETYNVYASMNPINDLNASDVVRIGSNIPRDVQYWNHRPYTSDGSEKTYYYAITATGTDGSETELTGSCVSAAMPVVTSATYKAVYVPNFNFSIDGSLAEFAPYQEFAIVPEYIGTDNAGDWTPESADINFVATFIIDEENLYIGANVIDDDLAQAGQAYVGDAFELYIGLYNALGLKSLHSLDNIEVAGTGDHRIGFCSWGEVQYGSRVFDFPGLESLILNMVTSYQIEAKLPLDSLGVAGWAPQIGDMMPIKIDVNDQDLVADAPDSGRTKQLHAGAIDNDQSWMRPSSWGYLEVQGQTTVDKSDVRAPLTTKLYDNYPNPFNPNTHIRYSLKQDGDVSLVIYNMLGQHIRTLVDANQTAGHHSIEWNGVNDAGVNVSSGIYLCVFKTNGYTNVNKMILMK
ncbi:T9SS type A sorting domain-containing protein [candidate division KSB1 bacterium]|nr:T9SS type A sorting domain-containing protein [candidate division KSB1 bacterium]